MAELGLEKLFTVAAAAAAVANLIEDEPTSSGRKKYRKEREKKILDFIQGEFFSSFFPFH